VRNAVHSPIFQPYQLSRFSVAQILHGRGVLGRGRARTPGGEVAIWGAVRGGSDLLSALDRANWARPIGEFRLVVDKGDPANLVSFCADGAKRISPTQYEVRKTSFLPGTDLHILILKRSRNR
jgi:hypothetical protein